MKEEYVQHTDSYETLQHADLLLFLVYGIAVFVHHPDIRIFHRRDGHKRDHLETP
jgi:hypothetical protein